MQKTVELILLGTAQDGGIPQMGCSCEFCIKGESDLRHRRLVVCLGILDHRVRRFWLVDATPDLPEQWRAIATEFPGYAFSGILLTHGHFGHYTGLLHLGKEAWNVKSMPIYGSTRMAQFLSANEPWASLLARHLEFHPVQPGVGFSLSDEVRVVPITVPHRGEFTDTLAFQIDGPERSLFFCPDIDRWDAFPAQEILSRVQLALVDGCFFSQEEIRHRDAGEIPHPLVVESLKRLDRVEAEVHFIHLNHTNPIQIAGPERDRVLKAGFFVGEEGMRWFL